MPFQSTLSTVAPDEKVRGRSSAWGAENRQALLGGCPSRLRGQIARSRKANFHFCRCFYEGALPALCDFENPACQQLPGLCRGRLRNMAKNGKDPWGIWPHISNPKLGVTIGLGFMGGKMPYVPCSLDSASLLVLAASA